MHSKRELLSLVGIVENDSRDSGDCIAGHDLGVDVELAVDTASRKHWEEDQKEDASYAPPLHLGQIIIFLIDP